MKNDGSIIAVGQMHSDTCEVDKNLSKIGALVKEAAASGARLITLPELCVTGYRADEKFPALAQGLDGEYVRQLRLLSRDNRGIWIYTSIPESAEDGGKPYNTAILVNDRGLAASYRKIHLWGRETEYFRAGNVMTTADSPVGRAGLHICFDVSFPEPARYSALEGADLLMYAFAFGNPKRKYAFDVLTQARALENGCYVMASNLVGAEKDTVFFGGSRILDPAGAELVNVGAGEGVACACLDRELLERVRRQYPYVLKRRKDIYSFQSYIGLTAD